MSDFEALADRMSVVDVLYRYATGIDRKDWVLFRSCFTDDCDCVYSRMGHWTSADEITAWMTEAHVPFIHTLHRITNGVIEIDGDTAVSRCYVHAVTVPAADKRRPREAFGYYDDKLVRTGALWKISERAFSLVWHS